MPRLTFTYKSHIKLQDLLNVLVAIFLFLTFLNFVTRNYYWLFIAFFLFIVAPRRIVILNFSTLLLFILGITMLVFGLDGIGTPTSFLKPFVFLMAYLLGSGMINRTDDNQKKVQTIERTIYLCAFGFFAHYVLNFITNIGALERNTIDIWQWRLPS